MLVRREGFALTLWRRAAPVDVVVVGVFWINEPAGRNSAFIIAIRQWHCSASVDEDEYNANDAANDHLKQNVQNIRSALYPTPGLLTI